MKIVSAGAVWSRGVRSTGRAAFALIAIACLTDAAHAQQEQKPFTPSLSSSAAKLSSRQSGGSVLDNVAAEPDTADAIAADTLEQLFAAADEHFHRGEWNHAINLNQIVIEGDPHNVEAFANNAYLLWSSDREALALTTLKKGLAANPNDYYMYDEIGMHYLLQRKDPADALPYYEQAVKFKCPAFTWHGLAHCYEKAGQWDKAVQAWENASKYPGDRIAAVQLKRAQARLAASKSGAN